MSTDTVVSEAASDPLFTPLRIGNVIVRNRLMQAAHSKLYAVGGRESQQEIDYFARRAEGGTALFIAGNRFVHPSSAIRGFVDGWRTDIVEADTALTDAVHERGARIFAQLNHHGAQASPDGPEGPRPVISASRMISPSTGAATIEATDADIAAFVDGWALTAENAIRGGFDGVEVHMAHGYLLHQFLSPLYNRRTDEYGGSLEARTRFPLEVLAAVRARVGDKPVVGIRIVANEFDESGLSRDDCLAIIDHLRHHVSIDYINLAGGEYHQVHYVFPSSAMPSAWLRDDVAAVKRRNPDIPVFGVGAAATVDDARAVIAEGVADMVALTRAQIADPDLATKLRTAAPVTHCIRLNQGCLARTGAGLPMGCTINPVVGREGQRSIPAPASRVAHVAVIGGGAAGLKAAAELTRNGHRVTLFEATAQLGGQLHLARRVPGRETVQLLIDDLVRDSADVDIRLETRVTAEQLVAASDTYDHVIIATGSRPAQRGTSVGGVTDAASAALSMLNDAPGIVSAWQAVAEPHQLRSPALIVDHDGTPYSAGVALAVAAATDDVRLVTRFDTAFPFIRGSQDRDHLHRRLFRTPGTPGSLPDGAFTINVSETVVDFDPDAEVAMLRSLATGRERTVTARSVVLATPREHVPFESAPLSELGIPVSVIGDSRAPRTIDAAIFDGFEAAFALGKAPASERAASVS
ncbi:FAD-dependent oxidoreductase [Paramicrobacterium agarici]|uniref:oxidoreductase n=1 Tax=Paramicrobacterium agarici TaxID=630514 RepID=UPI0011519E06|nr:FAD-dependent oxidoreductase [Microbacterium agarici]TQO23141.1 2,4-dienoyl-CoA reductase-like NADH-dependent reductase (Old Yellow Enzyme family) [Microbacterium agarici]